MSERINPMRVLRWHDRITRILDGERLGPIRAQIDLTNLCNHKCPWCEPLEYRKETIAASRSTLPVALAKQLLQDLAELKTHTIMFSGGGEPLLHPQFGELVGWANAYGFKIAVNTNGSLINKWMDALLVCDNVRISLDAANQKQHYLQHGKEGEFYNICEAISELTSHAVRTEVGIGFVVSDCNRDSLPDLETLRNNLGADFIYPREERGEVWGVKDFEHCYTALTTTVIGANGEVQACCDRRDIVVSNLYEQRFSDIWLSEKHRELAGNIVPQLCSKCVHCHYNSGVEQHIVRDVAKTWIV